MGAAIATLLLPFLKDLNSGRNIDVFYIFGSPRVGNQAFSDFFIKNNNFSVQSARIS